MTLPIRIHNIKQSSLLLVLFVSLTGCAGNADSSSNPLQITFLDISTSPVPTQVFYDNSLFATVPVEPFATPFPAPRGLPLAARDELLNFRPPSFASTNVPTVGSGPRYWGVLGSFNLRLLSFEPPAPSGKAKLRYIVGDTITPQVRIVLKDFKTGTVITSEVVSVFVQNASFDPSLNVSVAAGVEYITEVRDQTTNALLDRFGRFTPKDSKNYLIVVGRRGRALGKILEQPN